MMMPTTQANDSSTESQYTDHDLTNLWSNNPMSIDSQLGQILRMSFWQILSMLSYKSTVFINAFFLSLAGFYFHFETKENTISIIKGIGLGNMIMNVLCFDVCLGMNGAIETLISQAYGASKKVNGPPAFQQEMRLLCGKYLNLARLVNTVFMILPTVILFLFADEILITFFK